MKPISLTPDAIPELRSALLAHYDRRARDLPWRRDRDPYRVLVSEVMLQQTRVETVLEYYEPWLEQFPTLEALAAASEDEVMKAWEGLGYYRRARNLHRAARMVRERAGGWADPGEADGATIGGVAGAVRDDARAERGDALADETVEGFPTTLDGLRELPGVGEYTAGAVASIAFGEAAPAVDGNVRRVLARLLDEPEPRPAWLRRRAAELVSAERPGDWNQALMELGATVCTPRSPDCAECPVEPWCMARAEGTQTERPAPAARRRVPRARFALGIFEREARVLVCKRPVGGLLGGMWAFPEARMEGDGGEVGRGREGGAASGDDGGAGPSAASGGPIDAARSIADRLGLTVVGQPRPLEPVRHRFSHLDATYLPVTMRVAPAAAADERQIRWIDAGGDDSTALPVAQRRVLEAWRSVTAVSPPPA